MKAVLLDCGVGQDGDLWNLVCQMRGEMSQLRRELAELRCEAGYWKSRHADAIKRNQELEGELQHAKAEIRKLQDQLFGQKSERSKSQDRSNQLDDPQDAEKQKKKKRGQQPDRPGPARRDYSHLPVREETIELPLEQRVCPRCGKRLTELADTEDSEQIEIEVAVYRRVIHRKRSQSTCDCPTCRSITAAKPPKLIPKGRYGISLWVHLVLEKFQLQRPIHRILEQLGLYGLNLAAGSVADGLRRIEPMLSAGLRGVALPQRAIGLPSGR